MGDIEKHEFEIVFRTHYSALYHLALHYLQDADAAKDVVGEAFMAAWGKRHEVDFRKIDRYLYACVKNKSLTLASGCSPLADVDVSALQSVADDEIDTWQERERRISEIEKVIDTLPERTRHVLEQCYFNHQSYKQVAEEMGITTSGVKKHITKSLALLRMHFNIIKGK